MSRNLIYYFSGTGNSLHAAMEIARNCGDTTIFSMRCSEDEIPAIDADVIGFVFPVYHWTMPRAVKDFISCLQINTGAYIFGIASCGGLSVNTLNDLSMLLESKGAKLSYAKAHNNVASYVAAYEPFPHPKKQLPKAEAELAAIIKDIQNRISNKIPKKTLLKEFMRLLEAPFMKVLPLKDKGFHVSNKCISCALCSKICIMNNIDMVGERPNFKHNCAQCMGCLVYCPVHGINYKNKTQNRTKYHHPKISAKELIKNEIYFE